MGKAVYTTYESLAQKAGLIFDAKTGVIYGRRNGFDAFVYASDANYPYRLTVSIGANKEAGMLPKEAWKEFEKAHKPIQSVKNERNFVEMVLRPTNNKEKLGENFLECLDALTGFLMANGYVNCCYFCGQHVETQPYFVNQALLNLCPECSTRVTQELHMSGQEKKQKKENIVAGIVGALIGSLLGVLCIVILGQLGYVAALSGLVMAICTLKGYEMLGGKLSTKGIVISIVLMIVMTYVGNQLDWTIIVMRELGTDFLYSFQLVPVLVDQLAIEPSSYWGGLALVYVFAALGAVPTVRNVIKSQKNEGQMFRIGTM